MRLSAALFLILIGGTMFGYFLTLTRIPAGPGRLCRGLPLAPPLIVAVIFGIYFVMGALMEEIAILVIMTPIVYPVVTGLGYDGVWFGVMSIMMLLTGLLTPPVGLLSFVTSSATGVSLGKVYRGVTPFWMTLIVANALVIAFPDIALFLPHLMRADESDQCCIDGRCLRASDCTIFWTTGRLEQPDAEFAVFGERATDLPAGAAGDQPLAQRHRRGRAAARATASPCWPGTASSTRCCTSPPPEPASCWCRSTTARRPPSGRTSLERLRGALLVIAGGRIPGPIDTSGHALGACWHVPGPGARRRRVRLECDCRAGREQPTPRRPARTMSTRRATCSRSTPAAPPGSRKGAVLTQQAVVSNLIQIGAAAHRARLANAAWSLGPMLHAGVVWSTLAPLAWGGALYILESSTRAGGAHPRSRGAIGYAALVPTMLQACCRRAGRRRAPLPVAAPHPHRLRPGLGGDAARARGAFGCDVVQGYGLTEARPG